MDTKLSVVDKRPVNKLRVLYFLHGMANAAIVFNVLFLQTNGLDAGAVGVVMGINAIIGIISPPIWGFFADKIQSKYRIFTYTVLGTIAASLLIPLSSGIKIGGIILGTAFIPLANFFRMPSRSVLDAATVSACDEYAHMDYSDIRKWMSIGFTVTSTIYSPLVGLFGVGFPYYAAAFFAGLMVVNNKILKHYENSDCEVATISAREMGLSRLFKNYYLAVFLILNLFIMIPQTSNMMMPYLIEAVGADTSLVGIITGIRVLLEFSTLAVSLYIKRKLTKPVMMLLAATLYLIQMIAYLFVDSIYTLTLSTLLGGVAFGLVLSTAINYVKDLCPRGLEATAISLYSAGLPTAAALTSFHRGPNHRVAGNPHAVCVQRRAAFRFGSSFSCCPF